MNRPDMLHCTDMTVLEKQRARLKWQQEQSQQQQQRQQQYHQQQQQQQQQYHQQQQESYFSGLSGVFSMPSELMSQVHQHQQHGFEGGLMAGGDSMLFAGSVKLDPAMENWWPDLGKTMMPHDGFGPSGPGLEASSAISRPSSCPPAAAPDAVEVEVEVKAKEWQVLNEKMSAAGGRESFKKRKADKVQRKEAAAQEDSRDKRMKGSAEDGESKITEQNNNNNKSNNNNNGEISADTSKENSKASEVQKPDYIHVRARRGQATDSHSLAERVRREKISERMRYLQDLVPGCNKITGKAGMLDEIINYVQSLQRQVEFLSMKLAAVNPRLDFNIDNFFAKEAFTACPSNFPTIGMSSEMTNPAYLPFHPQQQQQQQLVSCSGLEMGINPSDNGLRRTISAPVSIPEPFLDSSCFPQLQPSTNWDADLQNYYNVSFDQGRSAAPFPPQPFTGSIEASNLKMEM